MKIHEKGFCLIFKQVEAILIKKIIVFKRNKSLFISQLLVPIVFCSMALSMNILVMTHSINPPPFTLNINAYPNPVTVYSLSEDYDSSSNKLVCLESVLKQYKGATVFLDSKKNFSENIYTFLVNKAQNNFYEYRNRYQLGALVGNDYFMGLYNDESYHTIAMSLSMVNNAWLKCLIENSSINYNIETINHPLPYSLDKQIVKKNNKIQSLSFFLADLLLFSFVFVTANFSVFCLQERLSGAKTSQLISGLNFYVYWVTNFCWDYLVYVFVSLCVLFVLAGSDVGVYMETTNLK